MQDDKSVSFVIDLCVKRERRRAESGMNPESGEAARN